MSPFAMALRRESEYGLDGLMTLAREGTGAVMTLEAIAARHRLPQSFLAKIFVKLAHHGLVRSFRGSVRGYALARSPGQITLREILEAIEGPDLFERCVFCHDWRGDLSPCPLHGAWQAAKPHLMRVAERTTLERVVRDRVRGRGAGEAGA